MTRAGLTRNDGVVVTSALGTDHILLQSAATASNAWNAPKLITVTNLLASAGDFTTLNLGANGVAGQLNIYSSTASTGNLRIVDNSTAGNFLTTLTIANQGQATVVSVPDAGAATANFVLSAGNATIAGNKTLTGTTQINTLNIGASGTLGALTIYPTTAANGTLVLAAVNNATNHVATISNNATLAQSTVYSLIDPGAATANFVLDAGNATIAGNKTLSGTTTVTTLVATNTTFTNVPIGGQYVIQVNLATITGLAGAVTALHSAMFSGTITKMSASVNAAFASTNIVITPSVYHGGSPTAVTNGAITLATAGSAVGTTAASTPSAANTFVSGDAITATITGGTGTCGGVISFLVTRTA